MEYQSIKGNEINGHLEIRVVKDSIMEPIDNNLSIHISGDKKGLKSLAEFLFYLANLNQEEVDDKLLPNGASEHTNLFPDLDLSKTSNETVVGRLDKKGSTEFPDWYIPKSKG